LDRAAHMDYQTFLAKKSQAGIMAGFKPSWLPDFLFDFQRFLVDWNIRKGRSATLAKCGMGKGPMALVWAQNVLRHTNRPVLIITTLGDSAQMVQEGVKFGVECKRSKDGAHGGGIVVTNYESLHHFNESDFGGVVANEVSAIKAFDGKRRKQVTRFLSKIRYRHGCTATPAPNDFVELGTISEAIGELSQSDMLGTFFKASDNMRHSLFKEGDFWNRAKWFFRAHSEIPFWRWVCTWARACQKPSDLGDFDDSRFVLPPLNISQHVVKSEFIPPGELFPRIAVTLKEQRIERRRTMQERCEKVAELVDHDKPALVWCQYNQEGDVLEKMIPGSVQIAGCNTDDEREERLEAFISGQARVLVSKPKCIAFGLNLQHCGHHTFFPSHSWEQFHQGIGRSWRFGRIGAVNVDVVTTQGEEGVTANLQKKQRKAVEMFGALVRHMHEGSNVKIDDRHKTKMRIPQWL